MCKMSHAFISAGLEALLTNYQQSYPQKVMVVVSVLMNQQLSKFF